MRVIKLIIKDINGCEIRDGDYIAHSKGDIGLVSYHENEVWKWKVTYYCDGYRLTENLCTRETYRGYYFLYYRCSLGVEL